MCTGLQKKLFLFFIIIIVLLPGCTSSNQTVLLTAISVIDADQAEHVEQLSEYDSPYTICYENKDGTYSMYIFASPIQYKLDDGRYAVIDNTVVKTEKKGFVFENKANDIKTYFPEALSDRFRVEKGDDFLEFTPDFDVSQFSKAKKTVYTNIYGCSFA